MTIPLVPNTWYTIPAITTIDRKWEDKERSVVVFSSSWLLISFKSTARTIGNGKVINNSPRFKTMVFFRAVRTHTDANTSLKVSQPHPRAVHIPWKILHCLKGNDNSPMEDNENDK